ncbi:hypothetical protein HZA85_04310 [Candidatus Uhrbacteria bacterium]|nr:hypothetical protein [Candidatus Uhrbacteria bacterium]
MLHIRQDVILRLVIEDYIQTAEPVGSKQLADRHGLDISPATIRSEMLLLEQQGYLRQPHPSAGRVPTEKAYLYYLKNVIEPERAQSTKSPSDFGEQTESNSLEQTLKSIAKQLVEVSGETAIVASDAAWSYYTGVSNLFAKPDFCELALLRSVSALVDQFDEVVAQLYDRVPEQTVVYIGSQNPFGHQMATVLVKYHLEDAHEGLLGLVGPLRMNYGRNIALIEQAKELILELYA